MYIYVVRISYGIQLTTRASPSMDMLVFWSGRHMTSPRPRWRKINLILSLSIYLLTLPFMCYPLNSSTLKLIKLIKLIQLIKQRYQSGWLSKSVYCFMCVYLDGSLSNGLIGTLLTMYSSQYSIQYILTPQSVRWVYFYRRVPPLYIFWSLVDSELHTYYTTIRSDYSAPSPRRQIPADPLNSVEKSVIFNQSW